METAIELDGQYRALREGAGLVHRSGRAVLLVRGSEAVDYLQGQLTNDLEAFGPGEGCYAALLDRKGHMQADMRVLRTEDGIWIDMEPDALGVVLRHLSMYKIGREVEIADVGDQHAILSLIGPAALEVAGVGPLSPEHAHRSVVPGGVAARAVATDTGVDLICKVGDAEALRTTLVAAGAVEISEDAEEIARVESGRPRFGLEMTTATIPQEAGIDDRAVSFTKGCYIGQETVARLHYRGRPNRHLRGLRLEAPVAAGDPVALGERELGRIGTAVISPAHGPIALAVLRREAQPGARVTVGDGVGAEVTELPF
ncbi:MAG TPA: folate-binding protein [Solirubrobacterales bacterium]|nr:folate-binding protein [Solirubrobacterales bacterium]